MIDNKVNFDTLLEDYINCVKIMSDVDYSSKISVMKNNKAALKKIEIAKRINSEFVEYLINKPQLSSNSNDNINKQNFVNNCVFINNDNLVLRCGSVPRLIFLKNNQVFKTVNVKGPVLNFQLIKNILYYTDLINIFRVEDNKSQVVAKGRWFYIIDNIMYFNVLSNNIPETYQINLDTREKIKLFQDANQVEGDMYIDNWNIHYHGMKNNLFKFEISTKRISQVIDDNVGTFVVCGNAIFYNNEKNTIMKNLLDDSTKIIDGGSLYNSILYYGNDLFYVKGLDLYRFNLAENTSKLMSKNIYDFGIANEVIYANIDMGSLSYAEQYKNAYLKVFRLKTLKSEKLEFSFPFLEKGFQF
ncbi:MAG: hypothetical protein WCQ41_04915 [Bacillota bacterium]